jgi:hypothetical protein
VAKAGKGGGYIASRLNNAGVPVFRKIGPRMKKRIEAGNEPKWHPEPIRQLLKNRAVIGYVQPCKRVDGKRVKDGPELRLYPAVIEPTLFEQVQVVLSGRKGRKGAGRKARFVNLFAGFVAAPSAGKVWSSGTREKSHISSVKWRGMGHAAMGVISHTGVSKKSC